MAEGSEPPRRAPAGPGTQVTPPPSPAGQYRGSTPSGRGGRRCAETPAPPLPCAAGCTNRTARGCGSGSAAGLCWSISACTTTGAEHPGMRTYCLGAETPEELNAWVCALRRGASPLPRSPCAPSLQMPQEPQSGGPPLSPRPCGWCPPWPPAEEVVGPPMPPTRHPLVPPLHPSKVSPRPEEAPARGEPRPMLTPPPLGRSLRELRPPWSSDHPAAAPSGRRGARCRGASHGGQSGTGFSTWLF
ncbi:uncharacterized protein LOC129783854 isoform X2 [Falco peregrinus]|uniref:uncharacterized protein LOC129783854 isoform X2 n=1 Tax=Falco peregrinus TaxID=8954 RepID=UPI00247B2397|nr:uncharacterized protein LOC129783854 isoform X2 [Falco peregrinus]